MEKITKTQARKLYEEKKAVTFCPSNLRPDVFGMAFSADSLAHQENIPFDALVDRFRYYNCLNRETGKGVAFYKGV